MKNRVRHQSWKALTAHSSTLSPSPLTAQRVRSAGPRERTTANIAPNMPPLDMAAVEWMLLLQETTAAYSASPCQHMGWLRTCCQLPWHHWSQRHSCTELEASPLLVQGCMCCVDRPVPVIRLWFVPRVRLLQHCHNRSHSVRWTLIQSPRNGHCSLSHYDMDHGASLLISCNGTICQMLTLGFVEPTRCVGIW